jgi:hypothetical protein
MLIALNKSDKETTIPVELPENLRSEKWNTNFSNEIKQTNNNQELILNLKPFSFEILNN